mmetsp:Transcript_11097/g.24218  ORF Transcript_11097/g.24218 Transcript_11097/m.24218 type:complete len:254 (+) Transcript_11097:692-1453(+)
MRCAGIHIHPRRRELHPREGGQRRVLRDALRLLPCDAGTLGHWLFRWLECVVADGRTTKVRLRLVDALRGCRPLSTRHPRRSPHQLLPAREFRRAHARREQGAHTAEAALVHRLGAGDAEVLLARLWELAWTAAKARFLLHVPPALVSAARCSHGRSDQPGDHLSFRLPVTHMVAGHPVVRLHSGECIPLRGGARPLHLRLAPTQEAVCLVQRVRFLPLQLALRGSPLLVADHRLNAGPLGTRGRVEGDAALG